MHGKNAQEQKKTGGLAYSFKDEFFDNCGDGNHEQVVITRAFFSWDGKICSLLVVTAHDDRELPNNPAHDLI